MTSVVFSRGLAEGILPEETRDTANHVSAAAAHVDRKSTTKRSAACTTAAADSHLLSLLKKPRTDISDHPPPPPQSSIADRQNEETSDNDEGGDRQAAAAATAAAESSMVARTPPNRRSLAGDEDDGSSREVGYRRRCLTNSPVGATADHLAGGHDEGERSNAENDKNRRNKNVPAFLEVDLFAHLYIFIFLVGRKSGFWWVLQQKLFKYKCRLLVRVCVNTIGFVYSILSYKYS